MMDQDRRTQGGQDVEHARIAGLFVERTMMARNRCCLSAWKIVAAVLFLLAPCAAAQEQPQQPGDLPKLIGAVLAGNGGDGHPGDAGDHGAAADSESGDAPVMEEPLSDAPVAVDEADVSVEPTGAITLNVVDLPLTTVLRVLAMETHRNIVASPGVTGTVTASLHGVTFEDALDAILMANNAAYRVQGRFIYVYTIEELQKVLAEENPPETRVFRLSYVAAKEVETAVTPLLSATGTVSVSTAPEEGLQSVAENGGGEHLADCNFVVVRDRPKNLEAIANLIHDLDVRPRQVLVEATILSAELSDDNNLGVDFTLLGGVDLELLQSSSLAIQNINVGPLPQKRLGNFNANATTDFTNNLPNGGVRLGIIKDHVATFVQALEEVTDTVVIANPKVLALNKQRGQVIVGRRDGFITTTVTETQAIQTVEFLETGTQLIFRPFIGDDGYIRMELHPEDSTGGLNASNLPFEQTTEVTTNVMVRDGQTILIGGLFRETDRDTRSQIPGLGDIPVLGTVFQSRQDGVQRQEIIVLLTVHIVKDLASYAEQSTEQREDMERVRVGHRMGHMWHGRERLAQSLYKDALGAYQSGDMDKALFKVRMSLHNNPKSLPALKLQERIRRKREWDEDGAVTRGFIQRAIMRDQGIDKPLYGREAPPFDPIDVDVPPADDAPDGATETMPMELMNEQP